MNVTISALKKTLFATEQDRDDIWEYRSAWRMAQTQMKPENLVFIDETGVNTAMSRLYGRCQRGERLVSKMSYKAYKSFTLVAAIRHDMMTAPCVFNGAMTGEMFKAYLETFLIPELKPNDCVIMDNLPAHKVKIVRDALKKANIQYMYLPPYSPDFNPIECPFSKIKSGLRKIAARTKETLEEAIVSAFNAITQKECGNYFENLGYKSN